MQVNYELRDDTQKPIGHFTRLVDAVAAWFVFMPSGFTLHPLNDFSAKYMNENAADMLDLAYLRAQINIRLLERTVQ
jgi:2-C-methyl-D-erythritol 4-phosphate cytidylyltransferase